MADPKVAPLSSDLKELALSLPSSAFPKSMFCALCGQLAVDSFKLLCCNKSICTSCQGNISFPTMCPSCDHSPLEADSCIPNKSARNTMRVWLQKQKKKEDAKAAAHMATPPVETTPTVAETQPAAEVAETPVESVEIVPQSKDVVVEQDPHAVDAVGDVRLRAGSATTQPTQDAIVTEPKMEPQGSTVSQGAPKSNEAFTANGTTGDQLNESGGLLESNPMVNGMQGQMGFFPNQAGFNNSMGWNGMGQMNGMPNMMNGNFNPMDFNMNGMYGNFGGSMGMGMGMSMNDMSAMNMMNYNGGFGSGFNGMGSGYGNFSGPNQMGGYNQSGGYPEMMNQFPKNNFSNQTQNRFHATQGGPFPQHNRNGSQGNLGPSLQNAHSRPESRSGPAQNRDCQSPDGMANSAFEAKAESEEKSASSTATEAGNVNAGTAVASTDQQSSPNGTTAGDDKSINANTNGSGDASNETVQSGELKAIQTFDSGDGDMQDYNQVMMGNGMQPNMPYAQSMMNQFSNQQMNTSFDPNMNMNMNMNMGYSQGSNFGPRSGFNNGAYGAARVLTGSPAEPMGVGVVGAPTGPRAMREGRPNTGFSSRMNNNNNNNRFVPPTPPPKSVSSAQGVAPSSPQRRVRSQSPQRDESLRVKQRSPSRSLSRSRSRTRDERRDHHRESSRSTDFVSGRDDLGRSATPRDDDYERRKEHRHHRSSRQDQSDNNNHDERHREDRGSRGDRTRDASADSKYRSSRRDKDKYRSSRSHRDRSREHRHRRRSHSAHEDKYEDDDAIHNGERESDGGLRRRHTSGEKDKYRERERDRERDRKDRKDRDRDYDYEREKDRSRDKDKERRRRRDRDAEDDERDSEDDKYRSSRRGRKDRERERDRERDHNNRDRKEKVVQPDKEEDVVGQMMKKRPVSPPLNAPTGPSANGFSIKGRSKNTIMPPPQPPTGPRASFQPPKGPAADRNKDRGNDHRRKSSIGSVASTPATSASQTTQDHYAAERERNARERDSRERVGSSYDSSSKSLASRTHSSSSHPSLSSKRSRDDIDDERIEPIGAVPTGPKRDIKAPTGPASHRDKRRKSGTTGDDGIVGLFTAGLRKKNASSRRGGVRTEGDVEREMEMRERERR